MRNFALNRGRDVSFSRTTVLLLLSLVNFAAAHADAQQPQTMPQSPSQKPLRELFVPFEEIDVLLGNDTRRVYLSRTEYEELLAKSNVKGAQVAPTKVTLLSANYNAEIGEGRGTIRGELIVEVLETGVQVLPLTFSGVGVRTAKLDDGFASIAKTDAGQTLLFVEGVGKHRLTLDFVMPVATDAAQQTLQFQIPTAPAGELELTVPGNIEIKSGAAVISREVDAAAESTRFKILPSAAPMSMVMSLNNKKLRDQSTVVARGVVIAEITQAYERLHATMSMGVLNGAVDEFRFAVDDDLEVNSVSSELMNRWSIDKVDGQQQLVVHLRTPATEREVINIRLDRVTRKLESWRMPSFQPLNVAGYSSVVGLLTEDRLRVSSIEPESLIAIDSKLLIAALPASLLESEPGSPKLNAVTAYYAAQSQFALTAQFAVKTSRVIVASTLLLSITDRGLEAEGGFTLMPQNEKLFVFDFECPRAWTIDRVKAGEQNLKFDRFEPANDADANALARIRVALPSGVVPGGQLAVTFHALLTPPDWLTKWDSQSLDVPNFRVIAAENQFGGIAVQVQDDLMLTPEATQGLLVMNAEEEARFQVANTDPAVAYRFESADWSATLKVTRVAPRTVAQVHSFVQLTNDSLISHTEINFDVKQSRLQSVSFTLPESTPAEIAIRGLGDTVVKETTSEVVDERRVWTVQLAERKAGVVRLAIDFTQPLNTQNVVEMTLPIARASAVAYQSGAIAVEGHSELEVEMRQSPRSVDIGELVDAEYQVGKRLIGVYGYVGNDDKAVAKISRRPVHRLPTTIVERAELVTLVSAQGVCQTAARFRLRTKAAYIETALPDDALLWSVMLDGKPALPQREGDKVLIAIPAAGQSTLRDLQLVYESKTNEVFIRGKVNVMAPELSEREDVQSEELPIPIADVKWDLVLPYGYEVTWTGGNLSPTNRPANTFSISKLMEKTWRLGGGGSLDRTLPMAGVSSSAWDEFPTPKAASGPLQPPSKGAISAQTMQEMDAPLSDPQVIDPSFGRAVVPNDKTEAFSISPSQMIPARDSEFGQAAGKETDMKKKFWAMEGVQSLEIELSNSTSSETHSMNSLGATPSASVSIINQARLQWLAVLLGVAVFVVGLVWLPRHRIARVRYFFAVTLIALLAPPVTGYTVELEPVSFALLLGLIALGAAILAEEFVKRLAVRVDGKTNQVAVASSANSPVTTIALSLILGCSVQAVAMAQTEQVPGQMVADSAELARLLRGLDDGGKVTLPADAVIIPFDPEKSMDVAVADKLLLPYEKYVELWNLANPANPLEDPSLPAKFAWSSAEYRVTLDARDSLQMSGTIAFELFTDNEVAIPLNLNGCVIEQAKLDGQPPRLQMIAAQPATAIQAQVAQSDQAQKMPAAPNAMYVLYTRGKGRKQLELQLRWQLDKRSGWRAVEGSLPATPASELTIVVPKANTEVRLAGAFDRSNFETSKADEQIVTTLAADGRLSLNWRDKITEASIDQGLTVQARSVFDIQEDALKLAWHGQFEFRRGRRESFTLQVPKDYIVEKIVGANIRGWAVKPTDAGQQVDVELLKSVSDRETLVAFISKQNAINAQATTPVTVPQIVVPDAMLHQGHIAVRRSLLLDVRAESTIGLTRIEAVDESSWLNAHEVVGILPIKVYQAYRYSQVPFDLRVAVNPVASKVSAQSQTLLKISQLERTLETRLLITSSERSLYRLQIGLPAEWKMQAPEVPGNFQWSLTPAGSRQLMNIYLADGQSNEFPVILRGELSGETQPNVPIQLPEIEVIGAQRQAGSIVVQADPAYDVRAENLQGCEPALLDSVKSWLNDKQRAAARVAVRFDGSQYSGQLQVVARTPEVSSYSVTNVKVTDRAIEETLFIEANIRFAGIREFVFQMPANLAAARIQAPHVQQKIVQPVEDSAMMVRVRLLLQDAIMGQFRVVVEHDRELTSGPHAAPLPVIETGTTDRRLVTLENVGRDELVTDQVVSFEPLDRSQLLQRFQADLLGGRSSPAYLAQDAAREPLLTFATKSREVLATAGARIGLAQTLLVIDELGTYRATQEYRIENRTEPFLEIELPEKARMWTVQVAGEPVKPAVVPSSSQRVRIPLIKTAEGDLDYPVVIKYGGTTTAPGLFSRVQFPLIHTLNINVELSQVRLRLPESYDWFNFHGTLGRVQSESDLQAGWLSYRTRQLTDLSQLLSSQKAVSDYTRARALNNLTELESTIQQRSNEFAMNAQQSQELGKQLSSNSAALKIAQQQAAQVAQGQTSEGRGNRALLNDLYGTQANGRSYNALGDLGQNFSVQTPATEPQVELKGIEESNAELQSKWFMQNKLDYKPTDEVSRLKIEEKFEQAPKTDPGKARIAVPFQQSFDSGAIAGKKLDSAKQQDDAKDSQAERYNRRLQLQRGRADSYSNQAAMGGGLEYADKANRPGSNGEFIPTPSQPDSNANGMGMLGGFGGGRPGANDQLFGAAGEANQMTNSLAFNAPAQPATQMPNLPQTVAPPAAYMASLDVELPVRGREYFFTTPRGDVELSGQAIATETYQRLYTIIGVLVAMFAVWCVYLLAMKVMQTNLGSAVVGLTLACFGAFALMQGLVPIYGVIALTAAAVLVFVKLDARTATTV